MPQFLSTIDPEFEAAFQAVLGAKREDSPDVDAIVADIIADVRERGDAAVIELTAKFDRLELDAAGLRFSEAEIDGFCAQVSDEDRAALELAADRIRAYHSRQMPEDALWTDDVGAQLGWRWTPVSAAGLYVPGGIATYPSSVLMNAIPAKVAGVGRLAMVVPTPDGAVNPMFCWPHASRVSMKCTASAAHRRWQLWPMGQIQSRPSIRSQGRATRLLRRPSGECLARSASI
jgi:histidinol dehydrogenase